jgi:hypothetical protein
MPLCTICRGAEVTFYTPVLQARKAELTALGKMDLLVVPMVHPVLEAIWYSDGDPLDETVRRLQELAGSRLPKGIVPAVDCVHLDRRYGQEGQVPLREISRTLAEMQIQIRPVVRVGVSSGPSRQSWHASREAIGVHGEGVCMRVLVADGGENEAEIVAERVSAAANWLGCHPEQVDVLVDVGAVSGRRQITETVGVVAGTLSALAGVPWRRMAVVASAFPDSISSVPPGGRVAFPRLDADIWRQLRASEQTWAESLSFGDHGVAGSALPGFGRPTPNLRYAAQTCWHIYRYPKDPERKFATFYDLCREVTSAPWWSGEAFSWGDAEIARRARRQDGPGNAVSWRAFSLSHHLAVVLEELHQRAR